MKARIALSIVLGLGTFIALSIADSFFTSPGHRVTPPVSWLVTALYLALAQFLLAPKGKGLPAVKPTILAMIAPVALIFFLALILESNSNIGNQIIWWLIICCGVLIGAAAASICGRRGAPPRASTRPLNGRVPR